MTKDEIILAQQVRIEQLKEVLWDTNKYLDQTYADLIGNLGAEWLAARTVDKLSPALSSALATPDDLSALRAHDAAIWLEAAQLCRNVYAFTPEENDSYRCMKECEARAEAIEKGSDK